MAVRTHSVMPGTPESGLPVVVQSRSPYATLSYAMDPAGGVTALTGYPSVYPHVLNVGSIPNFRAQYAQAPVPYSAYNAELMRLVMNGLQQRGGGTKSSGQSTSQQPATPPIVVPQQMAASHTSTLPGLNPPDAGPMPPGPPAVGPPAVPVTVPFAAVPSHESSLVPNTIPVPGMEIVSSFPFNGVSYEPYTTPAAIPQLASSHVPTLSQATGMSQEQIVPEVTSQIVPDLVSEVTPALAPVENPISVPAQPQTSSIWDRGLQQNLSQLIPLLAVSQSPDATLWDKVRAYYGIQNLIPSTFLQSMGASVADLLGQLPAGPSPEQVAPLMMPKPVPVMTPMGPAVIPMP